MFYIRDNQDIFTSDLDPKTGMDRNNVDRKHLLFSPPPFSDAAKEIFLSLTLFENLYSKY